MPLAPASSSLARETIRKAFEDLEKAILPADSAEFQNVSLDEVRKAAVDLEQQLAARQSLRNMRRLSPLLDRLQTFAGLLEPICAGTRHRQGVWAPITSVLRVASEHIEALEQVIKGYSQIAAALKCVEPLHATFNDVAGFQETLAFIYADIVQFHKHVYCFVHRRGWTEVFKSSWGRFQRRLIVLVDDIKKHQDLIDREANALDIAEARKMRQDLRSWRIETLEKLQRDEQESSAKDFQAIVATLKIDESDQLAIFDEISSEGAKHPGTCGWTIKNQMVRTWLRRTPDHQVLWLQGAAGSGKSVIATQLVNYLRNAQWPVISHFCAFSYATSIHYEQTLKSLILQLLRTDIDLAAHAYHLFVQLKKSPSILELERLVQSFARTSRTESSYGGYIWIILDGVDECSPGKQERLASLVNQITSQAGETTCKILISSRHSKILSKRLKRRQTLSLADQREDVNAAITLYSRQRFQTLQSRLSQLEISHGDVEDIAERIMKKADGMFLYARLVMDYIATNAFFTLEEIRTSVDELPKEITDFYQRILNQILRNQDSRSFTRIQCILGWIAFAKRPLRRLEILSALTFSEGEWEVQKLAPRYILDEICGPMVLERADTTMAFIHVSVQEFLQRHSTTMALDQGRALEDHCTASINCLVSGMQIFHPSYDRDNKRIRTVKGIHALHIYATEYWTEYLLDIAQEQGMISDMILSPAAQLVDLLEGSHTGPMAHGEPATFTDERLRALGRYPRLRRWVEEALQAKSLQRLEIQLLEDTNTEENDTSMAVASVPASNMLTDTLARHQNTIRFLLDQHDVPGVSAEELKFFKDQFQTSAFTCRLGLCPHATTGFSSQNALQEHELAHVRGHRCTEPGCQYPPFPSSRALKAHKAKLHAPPIVRSTIRRHPASSGTKTTAPQGHRNMSTTSNANSQRFNPSNVDQMPPYSTAEPQPSSHCGPSSTSSVGTARAPNETYNPGNLKEGALEVDDYLMQLMLLDQKNHERAARQASANQALPPSQDHSRPLHSQQEEHKMSGNFAASAETQDSGTPGSSGYSDMHSSQPGPNVGTHDESTALAPVAQLLSKALWDAHKQRNYDVNLTTGRSQWESPTNPAQCGGTTPELVQPTSTYWSVAEVEVFPYLLRSFGSNCDAIANHLGTKTASEVKSFYSRNHLPMNAHWVLYVREAERKKSMGEPLPPPPLKMADGKWLRPPEISSRTAGEAGGSTHADSEPPTWPTPLAPTPTTQAGSDLPSDRSEAHEDLAQPREAHDSIDPGPVPQDAPGHSAVYSKPGSPPVSITLVREIPIAPISQLEISSSLETQQLEISLRFACLSPTGKHVVCVGESRRVYHPGVFWYLLLDVDKGSVEALMDNEDKRLEMRRENSCFSHDGTFFATSGLTGEVYLWSIPNNRLERTLPQWEGVYEPSMTDAFHPIAFLRANELASALRGQIGQNIVRIRDASTGLQLCYFSWDDSAPVKSIGYSRNSLMLVTLASNGAFIIWAEVGLDGPRRSYSHIRRGKCLPPSHSGPQASPTFGMKVFDIEGGSHVRIGFWHTVSGVSTIVTIQTWHHAKDTITGNYSALRTDSRVEHLAVAAEHLQLTLRPASYDWAFVCERFMLRILDSPGLIHGNPSLDFYPHINSDGPVYFDIRPEQGMMVSACDASVKVWKICFND